MKPRGPFNFEIMGQWASLACLFTVDRPQGTAVPTPSIRDTGKRNPVWTPVHLGVIAFLSSGAHHSAHGATHVPAPTRRLSQSPLLLPKFRPATRLAIVDVDFALLRPRVSEIHGKLVRRRGQLPSLHCQPRQVHLVVVLGVQLRVL